MSSDRTREEVWLTQLAYREAKGQIMPTQIDPEMESILREILGDATMDDIKSKEAQPD